MSSVIIDTKDGEPGQLPSREKMGTKFPQRMNAQPVQLPASECMNEKSHPNETEEPSEKKYLKLWNIR